MCLPIKGIETYEITILLCPSRFHIIGSNFDGEYIEVSQPLIGSFNQLDILSALSCDRILIFKEDSAHTAVEPVRRDFQYIVIKLSSTKEMLHIKHNCLR